MKICRSCHIEQEGIQKLFSQIEKLETAFIWDDGKCDVCGEETEVSSHREDEVYEPLNTAQ